MKIAENELRDMIRRVVNEELELSQQDPSDVIRQGVNDLAKIVKHLNKEVPDDGSWGEVFEALDQIDAAVRALALLVPVGGKPSSLAGKGVQQKGLWFGSRG